MESASGIRRRIDARSAVGFRSFHRSLSHFEHKDGFANGGRRGRLDESMLNEQRTFGGGKGKGPNIIKLKFHENNGEASGIPFLFINLGANFEYFFE